MCIHRSVSRMLLAAILTTGACRTAEDRGFESAGRLVGGTPTSVFAAVGQVELTVNLRSGPAMAVCTGTLIAPSVVLTAAHCVDWNDHPHLGTNLIKFALGGTTTRVSAHRTLGSGAATLDPAGMYEINGDVALLFLETPISTVAPLSISTSAPAVGDTLTVVGFGCTSRGTMTGVGAKTSGTFTYGTPPRFACGGDSGGPLIDSSGAVVGVISGHRSATMVDFFGDARAVASTIASLATTYPPTFDPHAQAYSDVPVASPIFHHANVLRFVGVETAGALDPNATITRSEMSRWLIRAAFGEAPFGQPVGWWEPSSPSFADVPAGHPMSRYIERLWTLGVTFGCDATPSFCPDRPTTRGEFAAFLARTMTGGVPPAPSADVFTDVLASDTFAGEIAFLLRASALTQCGPDTFCPNNPITRGDAARMIVQAFFADLLIVTPPPPTVNPHFAAAYAYLRGIGLSSNDSSFRHALRSFCTGTCLLVPTMFGSTSDPTARAYCQALNGGSCNLIMRSTPAREDLAYFCGLPASCNNVSNPDLRSLCLGGTWCDNIMNPDLKSYCYGMREPSQCETINDYVLRNLCNGNCGSNAF